MTVAIDENIPLLPRALASCATVQTFSAQSPGGPDLTNVEALFVRSKTRVDARLLDGSSVRFVGTATAGTDHLDPDWLAAQGIVTAVATGCNANSVAEYVLFAALLWAERHRRTLRGSTIGIVGYGNVGRRVSVLARRLGMQVLVNDPPLYDAGHTFPVDCPHTALPDLVAASDIVTLHVPLVQSGEYCTEYLFPARLQALVRPGGLLIQTCRGGVVEEASLPSFLSRFDAALDVWEHEPVVDTRLAELCLLATPHIAGYAWEGKVRGAEMMALAFARWSGLQPDMTMFAETGGSSLSEPDYGDEPGLRELLRERRRLVEDDVAFRETLSRIPDERGRLFGELRRRYPRRHESLLS